jgi:sec-independent protein translocase protein TatC
MPWAFLRASSESLQYLRMTATAEPAMNTKSKFDPDQYRMTVGEHLEELRRRMILGLIGFAVVAGALLWFGDQVLIIFCRPLFDTLQAKGLNPQLYYTKLGEGFSVWLMIVLISAVAIASPWIVFQLWQFVAAGLYPHERKYVTRYAPLSIGLLIAGMLFVYFLVLPWTIVFFLDFAGSVPMPQRHVTTAQPHDAFTIPPLPGDPAQPKPFEMWYDSAIKQVKIWIPGEGVRVMPFLPDNLLAPHIVLGDYIDLVVGMLLMFGLSFQLPLIVMALAKMGIVDVAALRNSRRFVYFALVVVACVITPGDVVTASVALTLPLCLLYELGIWLAATGSDNPPAEVVG